MPLPAADVCLVVDFGQSLIEFGCWREAVEWYARYLPAQQHPVGLYNYGFSLLALGDPAGWAFHEFRWLGPQASVRRSFTRPRWRGQPLAGKRLLLWSEQGLGDTLQFVRFAALFRQRGAHVIAQVQPRLKALAAGFVGVDEVLTSDQPVPPFDYQLPMLSAPHALDGDIGTGVVPPRYIHVDAARSREWSTRLQSAGRLRVGLVWAGNPLHERDRYRSVALEALRPVLGVAGVRFFSVQKERRTEDDSACLAMMTDLGPDLHDFVDTAAVLDNLDLVICVDTAVAHLAGALGKPVWLLLPAVGDFRWGTEGRRTEWYPSMRLFRQQRLGHWDEVVEDLRHCLTAFASGIDPFDGMPATHTPGAGVAVDETLSLVAETRHGIIQYLPAMCDMAASIERYGEWLEREISSLLDIIPSGATILDASAGVGMHALALAKKAAPSGMIFAYEADPVVRMILAQNVAANRLNATVVTMRAATPWRQEQGQAGAAGASMGRCVNV
jgi:hypothetical protein